MTVQAKTENIVDTDNFRSPHINVTWAVAANGDSGDPFTAGGFRYVIFGLTGTFGSGGTCLFEGSNNAGTTWTTILDKAGNAVSVTSAGQRIVESVYELVRPRVSAGDGATALVPFCSAYR